jgi:hypothetical protein
MAGGKTVMSHVVKVKTVIKSLSALRRAAERCGLEMVEDQKHYRWYGRFVGDSPMPEGFHWVDNTGRKIGTGPQRLGTCDHVLRVKGNRNAYEVGVYQTGNDEYGITWDWWQGGNGLQSCIGKGENDANVLLDEYAFAVAEEVAIANGWMTERTEEGLVISVWDPVSQTMGTVTITAEGVDANGFTGGACQDPVTRISDALGVKTEESFKPEFFTQNVHLYESN